MNQEHVARFHTMNVSEYRQQRSLRLWARSATGHGMSTHSGAVRMCMNVDRLFHMIIKRGFNWNWESNLDCETPPLREKVPLVDFHSPNLQIANSWCNQLGGLCNMNAKIFNKKLFNALG